jgi:hypothetical protein
MMMRNTITVLCSAFMVVAVTTPAESARKQKRIVKQAPPAALPAVPSYRQTPARMIEVRPGRPE